MQPRPTPVALCRAHLFAPGSNARLLAKVFDAGADAVVLDLEDAVAPAAKDAARQLTADALSARPDGARPLVAVRINGLDSPWWQDDLDAVVHPAVSVIRLPKAESAAQLVQLDARLRHLEARRRLQPMGIAVVATIESAAGVLAAEAIGRAPRVRGFTFGAADFTRDIAADPAADEATLYARQRMVLVSRALGLDPPIASVYTAVRDLDGLRRTTEEARALGFFGRSCIHPDQVPVIQNVFTPSAAAVDAARAVLAAWEDALSRGQAALTMPDGQFVDEAVARRARAVLALAASIQESSS